MASGKYVYAVKALYTNGESELTFSNILDFVYVNNSIVSVPDKEIYPNPAKDVVTIAGSLNAELIVYGMDGRVYSTIRLNSDNYWFEVSHLARGPYILVLKDENGIKQQKLLLN
jgi:hypothetical protein